ncbi:MAG: primosomal protein N' [Bacteroidaceae bacterium]|nr:primosomal protein N' [Bacteroidaceae bacterium]
MNKQNISSPSQQGGLGWVFADVIVPLPLANSYTYRLPADMEGEIQVGSRVIVPFGQKKFYTAIVIRLHNTPPEGDYQVKPITEVLDPHPIVTPAQLAFWQWVAEYYLCTLGDVYKAALPSGMKLESETRIELNLDFSPTEEKFLPNEEKIFSLLTDEKERTVAQIEKETGIKNALPAINALLRKEAIFVKEEVKRTYKPKTEIRIRLRAEALKLRSSLKRAPKQQQLLTTFLKMGVESVSKKELLATSGASSTILNQLIEKGIFESYTHEIGRLEKTDALSAPLPLNPLNPYQTEAFNRINDSFATKHVCLLHGVTSSGKTEIYIHLIQQALTEGKQVLYLLPEIALTTQITERLRRVFGSRLGVYHSKFPDEERVEIWQKQLSAEPYDIILGVRSSVFLPFQRLGLVIVDEEHENTYKQQDPAPRYHARNGAIVLASMQGAKVLLGTATPSIESYYNALTGKYALVTLTHRHQSIQLPEIQVVDIAELRHKRRMNGPFSPELLSHMRRALEQGEQIILFQNRRGFAPMVECKTCGWVPRCKNCDVSLTFHRGLNQLTCHYCGYTYQIPATCPACESEDIRHRGFGTERIEESIQQIFPDARVARMDLDTTRTRQAYERIIRDFQAHQTDILIGTQMVSKGLDFEHVSVVGILDADTMMNFPDFRSHERAFQLMAQVAGRAGRKHRQGLVILQTRSKDAPVIHQVVANDYASLYDDQLAERLLFRYPPYYRLIYIYLKHRHDDLVNTLANEMAMHLRTVFGDRILGPDAPPVARVQTFYIRKIMLKMETSASLPKVRQQLRLIRQQILADPRFRSCIIHFDVDPC